MADRVYPTLDPDEEIETPDVDFTFFAVPRSASAVENLDASLARIARRFKETTE